MKKLILIFLFIVPVVASAAGAGVSLKDARVDLSDRESLQRGGKLFVNYCLSCHSASYMRFNGMARDLGIPEDVMLENMVFTTDKIGNNMKVAMRPSDAKKWLGVAPPDLSVIARSRGPNWIYTFLDSYYADSSKATGVNNLVFKDTAMPHVLLELQGLQKPVYDDHHGDESSKVISDLTLATPGKMSESEFRTARRDLVNFMVYMGEPAKLVRKDIGFWVIIFLLVLLVPAYLLKKEYWKDVR
ncbi:MAG: cytochrome c1 [Gammaproteobacteria bacterium]